MLSTDKNQINEDLILIGGGHSNLRVIKDLIKNPIPKLRVTLISNVLDTPYSGMLPGYVEGLYQWRDANIDLYKLSSFGNFRFIHDEVKNISGNEKKVFFTNRPSLEFDYLSINIGIQSDFSSIIGAKKHSIPMKPISKINYKFLENQSKIYNIAVIGAGAAGVEISLALKKRLRENVNIYLFSGKRHVFSEHNKSISTKIKQILLQSNIKIIENDPVNILRKRFLLTSKNLKFIFDKAILATNGVAPNWIKKTDIKLCKNGFVLTNNKFQTNYNYIFASGDIINFSNYNLPKAGVYAVKSGLILSLNIRNLILKKKLKTFKPQKYCLSLIGLANNTALGHKYGLSITNYINFKIKQFIDKNFIKNYTIKFLKKMLNVDINKNNLNEMLCRGCAAKVSIDVIKKSIPSNISLSSLDASLIPTSKNFYQSVDMINSIITDPYKLGMISANHSLSDIYASGSQPISAQMILQLPLGKNKINKRDFEQIYSGAKYILDKNSCELSGGHTMIGEDYHPVIGFSLIGKSKQLKFKKSFKDGDLLILTGKIGTGLIFAGINLDKIDSFYQIPVLNQMICGNLKIGRVLKEIRPICSTDITGFGLSNHLINLVNRFEGLKGLSINVKNIQVFDGVKECIKEKVKSSLFNQNYNYAKNFLYYQNEKNSINEILFDPQTVGGIAFIIPIEKKEKTLKILNEKKISYSIIGRVNNKENFLKII